MVVSSLCIKQCFLEETYQKCTKNYQKSQKNRTHVLQFFFWEHFSIQSNKELPYKMSGFIENKCLW